MRVCERVCVGVSVSVGVSERVCVTCVQVWVFVSACLCAFCLVHGVCCCCCEPCRGSIHVICVLSVLAGLPPCIVGHWGKASHGDLCVCVLCMWIDVCVCVFVCT